MKRTWRLLWLDADRRPRRPRSNQHEAARAREGSLRFNPPSVPVPSRSDSVRCGGAAAFASIATATVLSSLWTNSDDRLPVASLGRVEGGDSVVEARDAVDVGP